LYNDDLNKYQLLVNKKRTENGNLDNMKWLLEKGCSFWLSYILLCCSKWKSRKYEMVKR